SGTVAADIDNFRTVAVPHVIERDTLFRSGKLYSVSDSDAKQLEHFLKGGLVVDLREKREFDHFPDKPLTGVEQKNYPVYGTQDYTKFVFDANSRHQFGRALTDIADAKGNVLVHCNLGRDRTGWLVAMLMYAVGADGTDIVKEYMRSNRQRLTNGDRITVQQQWLRNGVNAARDKYGSLDNYLRRGLGVTDDTLAKLKTKFEPDSA
ncbi:MAG: tyrosine-protein phosphatase, partial [Candidatus Nomurabacteria bacterium]|nr:tyrosine-protein phosphatase [Candidatus Nomurabacteria bacterium]